MIAEPQQQPHDKDRSKRERRRDEKALDEALKNTFPASDPVSVEQPVSTWKPVQTATVMGSLKKARTMNSNVQRAAAAVSCLMTTTTMKK
jgi:hypothetical protein